MSSWNSTITTATTTMMHMDMGMGITMPTPTMITPRATARTRLTRAITSTAMVTTIPTAMGTLTA